MTDNQDAMRRADELEAFPHVLLTVRRPAAAHIRRLVAENEREREARIKAQSQVTDLQERIARADVEQHRAVRVATESAAAQAPQAEQPAAQASQERAEVGHIRNALIRARRYVPPEREAEMEQALSELAALHPPTQAEAVAQPVAWALAHSKGLLFSRSYPMCNSESAAKEMARRHLGQSTRVVSLYLHPPTQASEQDRRDAERYRWIKSKAGFGIKRNQVTELNMMLDTLPNSMHELDTAIDAAIKREGGE